MTITSPFIINFKNYLEISGEKSIELSKVSEEVSNRTGVDIIVAPPPSALSQVCTTVKIPVISQHADFSKPGSTTGFVVPEIIKSYGAVGSLVNHSEHRIDLNSIRELVSVFRDLQMVSIVCVRTPEEAGNVAKFNPDFIAIEPPELIGSGKAVSKENPSIVTNSITAVAAESPTSQVICGAGIVDKADVESALSLGAHGILVASGIIKASSWADKIYELASGFNVH
ncbi:MAG TPA: triose-phosphate isomerase [Nitrososphaeraceae archaeon]|nr:triose-phosphate isomerase [Nitrososphaeraceae archaeon]